MSTEPKTAMEKAAAGARAAAAPKAAPAAPAKPLDAGIRITAAAADRIRALVKEQEIPAEEQNLRISLRVGGCSGFSYEMGFDHAGPGDAVQEAEGVRVVVDPKDLPHLKGLTIDFVDTVQEQGFKIVNPNAKSSCGCGQSFEA